MDHKIFVSQVPTAGINEARLSKLKIEINDYAQRINNVFQCIGDLVDGTKLYFDCESGNLFRDHFDSLKENFAIVNQNILSYTEDLSKVEINYRKSIGGAVDEIFMNKEENV